MFRNSGRTYDGIPIMASSMEPIGTFDMAKKLSKVLFITGTDGLTHTINGYSGILGGHYDAQRSRPLYGRPIE